MNSNPILDLQVFYGKARAGESLNEAELSALLKELVHFRRATAYLASCHAATAECLPKSRGVKERARQKDICQIAAQFLDGESNIESWRFVDMDQAKQRCLDVLNSHK